MGCQQCFFLGIIGKAALNAFGELFSIDQRHYLPTYALRLVYPNSLQSHSTFEEEHHRDDAKRVHGSS